MTTKEELINRLINWLDEECPNVAPPLEPYSTLDLSHDFAGILRSKLDKILATPPQEQESKEQFRCSNCGELIGNCDASCYYKKEEPQEAEIEKGIIEFALTDLFNDLQKNAYNFEYHNYHYKEANQIIRKHFEAMEQYHKAQMREEIIKWMEDYYEDCGGIDHYTIKHIDEYLNNK